jgi:hypothetical protein
MERRVEILGAAIEKLAIAEAFDSETLWNLIYSKQHPHGFEPTFQRATHLITSKGRYLRTEDYSLNFVFNDPADDYYYEFLYSNLPYVLTFLSQVTTEAFNRLYPLNERTLSHLLIVVMGCYEALFVPGKRTHIAQMLRTQLKSFLNCMHCDMPLKLTKKTAPELYVMERLPCPHCGLDSEVPLAWMFSQVDVRITRKTLLEARPASREKKAS